MAETTLSARGQVRVGPARNASRSDAGFEVFFERIAEAFNQPGGPDMPRIIEISAEHGIYFVPPEGA
jgi:hypothetical protein